LKFIAGRYGIGKLDPLAAEMKLRSVVEGCAETVTQRPLGTGSDDIGDQNSVYLLSHAHSKPKE
jgi:hypothetical protein